MKIKILLILYLLSCRAVHATSHDFSSESVITFTHSGGRMGDGLIAYLHAKWLSYQTGMPLLCRYWGFNNAQEFVLYDREIPFDHTPRPSHEIRLNHLYRVPKMEEPPTTYTVPYFPETYWEWKENGGNFYRLFEVDWKDPDFRHIAREMVAPKNPLSLTLPPEEYISVAIHVREGGGHDTNDLQYAAPLKRPPFSFYAKALRELIPLFGNRPLFCQIFTDALQPEAVSREILQALPEGLSIELCWRTEENNPRINVVDDFFSLFHYDVLIRPDSNFSLVPSLLHDYAVVIYPKHAVMTSANGKPVVDIDEIEVSINTELVESLIHKFSEK